MKHFVFFFQLEINWNLDSSLLFRFSELGMVCVVRSAEDHRWYRAQFMEQKEKDMCEVVYLDYGNMETVNVSEIREMDEKLRFPCITVSCYIDGMYTGLEPSFCRRNGKLLRNG